MDLNILGILIMENKSVHLVTLFLAAQRSQVQKVIRPQEDLAATVGQGVRVVDVFSFLDEDAVAKVAIAGLPGDRLSGGLRLLPGVMERSGAVERERPAHPLLELVDLVWRGGGHGGKRGIPTPEVLEMRRRVVHNQRAAVTALLIVRAQHEVVQDELLAAVEEVG